MQPHGAPVNRHQVQREKAASRPLANVCGSNVSNGSHQGGPAPRGNAHATGELQRGVEGRGKGGKEGQLGGWKCGDTQRRRANLAMSSLLVFAMTPASQEQGRACGGRGGGDDGAEQHRQNTERYPCQHTSQRVTLSSVSSVSRWVAYIYIYIYTYIYIYIKFRTFLQRKIHSRTYIHAVFHLRWHKSSKVLDIEHKSSKVLDIETRHKSSKVLDIEAVYSEYAITDVSELLRAGE